MTVAISSLFAPPPLPCDARPDPAIDECLNHVRIAYLFHSGHFSQERLARMEGCTDRTIRTWCWRAARYRLPESEGLRRHLGLDLDDSELIDVPS